MGLSNIDRCGNTYGSEDLFNEATAQQQRTENVHTNTHAHEAGSLLKPSVQRQQRLTPPSFARAAEASTTALCENTGGPLTQPSRHKTTMWKGVTRQGTTAFQRPSACRLTNKLSVHNCTARLVPTGRHTLFEVAAVCSHVACLVWPRGQNKRTTSNTRLRGRS